MLNKDELNKLIEDIRNGVTKLRDINIEIRKAHPEILLEAIKVDGTNIRYVSDEEPYYFQMALEAVKQNGLVINKVLMHMDYKTENFHMIALEAAKQNYKALLHIGEMQLYKLPNYRDIALATVKQSPDAITYLGYKHLAKYPDVLMEAVKADALALLEISPQMINKHPDIAIEAIKAMKEGRIYKDKEVSDAIKDATIRYILGDYEEVIYSGLKKLENEIDKCEGETRKNKMKEYENIAQYLAERDFLDEEERPITRYELRYTKEDISEISPRQGEMNVVLSETILETERDLNEDNERNLNT